MNTIPRQQPFLMQNAKKSTAGFSPHLNALIDTAHQSMTQYDAQTFVNAAGAFIDDLSNWYIRRNRRRFWRAKDASDDDKLAAYQTLHEVLTTLSKLLAPITPFLAERMYKNLVTTWDATAPISVHLCDFPTVNKELLDPVLNDRTATIQRVVKLGHKMREQANLRVRQPLAELRIACNTEEDRAAITAMSDVIRDELNIKQVHSAENLDDIVSYSYKPNLKTLGPKYGKLIGTLRAELPKTNPELLAPLRNGDSVTLTFNNEEVTLESDDVLVSTEQSTDWICTDEAGIQVALSTVLNDELILEGMARDFVRHIQQERKDSGLEIENRISISSTSR